MTEALKTELALTIRSWRSSGVRGTGESGGDGRTEEREEGWNRTVKFSG